MMVVMVVVSRYFLGGSVQLPSIWIARARIDVAKRQELTTCCARRRELVISCTAAKMEETEREDLGKSVMIEE